MRCPYCNAENDEAVEYCQRCGEQLNTLRTHWSGPATTPVKTGPTPQTSSGYDEWDPARRHSQPQQMSAFVPPANYPTHITWIITVIFLGIPATAIHAILFWRGVSYPHNLGVAVGIIILLCLPLSLLALFFSWLVRVKQRAYDGRSAYRFSRTTGLLCWIALVAALALYVILFMRLMQSVGEFWTP